jgi:acyl carrier protein
MVVDRLLQHGGGDRSTLQAAKDVNMITDVAVDSLHMVEIVLELEEALGVSIPHSDMTSERMRSVNRFADYLYGKCSRRSAP